MKATLVRDIHDSQKLFRCDPPIAAHRWDDSEPAVAYEYVVSSRCLESMAQIQGCYEVYLFGAGSDGEIVDWTELPGSQKQTDEIEKPLRDLGYEIIMPETVNA